MQIMVYNTHIEISPYKLGDCEQLEKMQSKYDNVTHKLIPIGYYIEDDILYIPRGINLSLLMHLFNVRPSVVPYRITGKLFKKVTMLSEPRDKIQEDAINFLLTREAFIKGAGKSQFGLNLDTGDGKTYCMTNAIMQMRRKTIVITHQQKIKDQWIDTVLKMTDIDKDRICDIHGSEVIDDILKKKKYADIYYVNHQTLNSYARAHGWKSITKLFDVAQISVKVFDEAHKFFENSLMLDYFTNTEKTFYITATFTRSDPKEIRIFEKAFSNVYRFGEETYTYEEKRRHINFVIVYYHSQPTIEEQASIKTKYGFSAYNFIDYALSEQNNTMMRVLQKVLDQTDKLRGKVLIISPKTSSVDYIADQVRRYTTKSVGTIHSKNSEEYNKQSKNCDIISSTIKSVGEGADIKGLRVLIDLEPVASKSLADQVRGRLREYSDTDDTFFYYFVDTAIPENRDFVYRILPVMKKKCKQIYTMRVDDI